MGTIIIQITSSVLMYSMSMGWQNVCDSNGYIAQPELM